MRIAAILISSLVAMLSAPAHASWLDWTDNMPSGNPAISFSERGGVSLVLPEAALAEAAMQGLDAAGAARLFLNRWAPRVCSDIGDMGHAHAGLAVTLRVQHPVAIEDTDPATMDMAVGILNGALAVSPRAVPRIRRAFVVDQQGLSLTIDYSPDGHVKCSEPQELLY